MTIVVKIAFDGTEYHGSQIQENAKTVFGEFQKALIKVLGYKTDIKGCSRTDSGVHASAYYMSFEVKDDTNLRKLPLSINANLPLDIRVVHAKKSFDGFHARYDAVSKQYTYYIKNSHIESPFNNRFYYRIAQDLDIDAMRTAAEYFIGTHDFTSFMSQSSKIIDCERTVFKTDITQNDDMIIFKISANGYLYNMVRIMVGTLIWVGTGKINPSDVKDIIKAKDRSKAGVTAPAKGLFLTDVIYE